MLRSNRKPEVRQKNKTWICRNCCATVLQKVNLYCM